MPFMDFMTTKAGWVPHHDVVAQERCYKYLQDTIDELMIRDAENPSQNTRNLISMYTSIRNLAENTEGSRLHGRAHSFWNNWDRNKNQIIAIKEGTDDEIAIQDVLEELEDGRYIES